MARLVESPKLLTGIKDKALQNAIAQSTYGTRAEFTLGKTVIDFEQQCEFIKRLKLKYLN